MLRKLNLILAFSTLSVFTYGQGLGTIQGTVKDKSNGEVLPFVTVVIELNGVPKGKATSDLDGKYKIPSIEPGTYSIKCSFVGYKPFQANGVPVSANKIQFYNIEMEPGDVTLDEVVIVDYAVPLIDKDGGASGATVTRDDIAKMAGRSATSIAQTVGGVYSQEGTGDLNIRGARSSDNYYFIDGIKVRGSSGLPKASIQEVQVITGGMPANYGDATGGIVSITTRGPSAKYFGGIDILTSGFKFGNNPDGYGNRTFGLDRYAYNLIEGTISGPLWMKKDSTGKKVKPILGFFLSGNFNNVVDGRPFATPQFRVKEDVRNQLLESPLRPTGTGFGAFYNVLYLTADDFEKVRYRQNAQSTSSSAAGKIDVNLGPQINLTFGGSMDYISYRNYDFNNMLFNYQNNGKVNDLTWRAYTRFTQRFNSAKPGEEQASASSIKNAYYTVMIDYSNRRQKAFDPTHKDNIFNYGYVGQFDIYRRKSYQPNFVGNDVYFEHNGFADTLVVFTPSAINADLASVTSQYFTLYDEVQGNYENLFQIQLGNGLRNGDPVPAVYNIWSNIGNRYNNYSLLDQNQFRITASGNADIGNHAISIGFEFEQRNDKFFAVSPRGLWTLGRQLTGAHLRELDVNNGDTTNFGSFYLIDYPVLNASPGQYDASDDFEPQSFFDYNLRNALGLNTDGVDYVNLDAVDPNLLKLSFFNADELLNAGNSFISYYGYNYDGTKAKGKTSFEDFFNKRDAFGNKTRNIAPFQPIYIAGYVMDKFAFDDLIFNIGLRVDRFDANQPVLKDRFLLYEAKTVKEVTPDTYQDLFANGFTHPTNMGADYVVYVNDINQPTQINGYRNGNKWYNADGIEIADPTLIYGPGGVAPLLVNPNAIQQKDKEMIKAFVDYKPQINVMPRIAFSFPISDEALFFAHYDILTKRPTAGNRLDILDYYFVSEINQIVNNPDLKPEKTIDYELGFQQVLTKSSSFKLSAFYRELRNQVALVNVTGAYPKTYRSYGNIDFGTVKGLTLTYDLRRTANLSLRASYTLQFAEGTGSDAVSALGLVNSGQPNLRTIYPFEYDQRHAVTGVLDYRYGEGKDYNGPKIKGKNILENTGVNLTAIFGSGTPYTARQFATPQALIDGNSLSGMQGEVNGSRKPGQFRLDAQIDRNITIKYTKGEKTTTANLNIYFQINNILNNINILNVYGATGNPDDDGYLTDARYTQLIAQQNSEESFRQFYQWKVNSPFNYGIPRTIRLGIRLDF